MDIPVHLAWELASHLFPDSVFTLAESSETVAEHQSPLTGNTTCKVGSESAETEANDMVAACMGMVSSDVQVDPVDSMVREVVYA